MYPMEIKFCNDTNTNFYLNFGVQFLGFSSIAIFFQVNLLIFFIFVINVIYELKLISKMCLKVGDTKEEGTDEPTTNLIIEHYFVRNLSTKMKKLWRKYNDHRKIQVKPHTDPESNRDQNDGISVKTLINTIIKYHTNILS